MAQIRIGFERVQPGSAAREAETADRLTERPAARRIQAGSAARMAEEAKRAEAEGRPAMPTLSLRAANGRVQRRQPASGPMSAAETVPPAAVPSTIPDAQSAAPPPVSSTRFVPPHAAPAVDTSSMGGVRRLTTFFRGLFAPEEPSQP